MKSTKWLNKMIGSNSYIAIAFIIACFPFTVRGQSATLSQYYQALDQHHPLTHNKELLQQQSEQNDARLAKGYLPQVQALGQATYQSEVTAIGADVHLPIPGFTGFPVPAKDQYKATVSLQQSLFDGGNIAAQRKANQLSGLADQQQNAVSLYQVKEQVNSLFFQGLLLDENVRISESALAELQSRLKARQGALKYGTAQASEVDALQAEILKMQQTLQGLTDDRITIIQNLNTLTGATEPANVKLLAPADSMAILPLTSNRPEYELFNRQKQAYDAQLKITKTGELPKVSLFGEENYGRPGYDFLRTNFGQSWLVGAKITFNLSSFYTQRQDKKLTSLKQQQVDVQQSIFHINQSQQYTQQLNAIQKLNKQLTIDDQIISLRGKVRKASAAKLDNGVVTVTDYVTDLQAEEQAMLTKALHYVQKQQAAEALKLINGSN